MKYARVMGFENFVLRVKQSGYGAADGSAEIQIDEKDVDWHPHDDREGSYLLMKIDRSELIDLRDWLTAILGEQPDPSRFVATPHVTAKRAE